MNEPYKLARVKLSLLYFVIIFFIVFILSSLAISTHNSQFQKFESFKQYTEDNYVDYGDPFAAANIQRIDSIVQDVKKGFLVNIIILDMSLLTLSAFLSYFLSGQTLEPIIQALNKQKKFVSDASHELRTPLTAIKTEAEVLNRSKRATVEEYKEFTQSLIEEINKLSSLTQSLLQIAKLDNNKDINPSQKVDVNSLLEKLTNNYKKYASKNDVELLYIPSNKNLIAKTDEYKLERLLSIIIDNAIKYNMENGKVTVETDGDSDHLFIKISDTGIGIDPKHINKIFDRFYRASDDRNDEGFGLGLSIAKELADQIQANLKVESVLGNGTTFTIGL